MSNVQDILARANKVLGEASTKKPTRKPSPGIYRGVPYFRQLVSKVYAKALRHDMRYFDHYEQLSHLMETPNLAVLHVYAPVGHRDDVPRDPQAVVYHAHTLGAYQCAMGCHVGLEQGTGTELDDFVKYQNPDLYSYDGPDEPFQTYSKPENEEFPTGYYWV